MKLPQSTKSILIKHNVNVDLEKDYSNADIVVLMDKIVVFLDRKLKRMTQLDIEEEENTDNLEQLKDNVRQDFILLGVDGALEKYTVPYLLTLHKDSCYTIVSTIITELKNQNIPIGQLWSDIVANYGSIPNKYQKKISFITELHRDKDIPQRQHMSNAAGI